VRAQTPDQIAAIHARQAQIGDDEIDRLDEAVRERRMSVEKRVQRSRRETLPQCPCEQFAQHRVVLDENEAGVACLLDGIHAWSMVDSGGGSCDSRQVPRALMPKNALLS